MNPWVSELGRAVLTMVLGLMLPKPSVVSGLGTCRYTDPSIPILKSAPVPDKVAMQRVRVTTQRLRLTALRQRRTGERLKVMGSALACVQVDRARAWWFCDHENHLRWLTCCLGFSARHRSVVKGSGSSSQLATASPNVTRGFSWCRNSTHSIATVLMTLQRMTTTMMWIENCNLQLRSVFRARQRSTFLVT